MDATKLKVAELKRELKARGLPTTGNKQELTERLQTWMLSLGESELAIDDLAVEDDEEEVVEDDDQDVDDDALSSSSHILSLETPGSAPDDATPVASASIHPLEHLTDKISPTRKITLNRSTLLLEKENMHEKKEIELTDVDSKKVIINPASMTQKERLLYRARKFGIATEALKVNESIETKATVKGPIKDNITTTVPPLDVLKRRAERFGTSVSSFMKKAELEDLKRQRRERFSIMDPLRNTSKVHLASEDEKVQSLETSADCQDSPSSASKRVCVTPHDSASLTAEDKKKQRAERFKIM